MGFSAPPPNPANSIPTVKNFDPSVFKRWRRAKARVRSGTGRARILAIGDSTTLGVGGGPGPGLKPASWVAVMTKVLAGLGLPAVEQSFIANGNISSALYPTLNPEVVLGAGWGTSANEIPGGNPFSNTTTTNALSFTPSGVLDTIEFYSMQNTGLGSWTYDVDGGTTTTVNSAGSEAYVKTVATVAKGAHTINVKRVSGNVFCAGIVAYDSTVSSVDVLNVGRGSGTSTTFSDVTRAWSPKNAYLTLSPDLVTIEVGINDYTPATLVPLSTFISNVQGLISLFLPTADVVIIVPPPSDAARQDLAIQAQYRAALAGLAASNNIPLFDLASRWGSYSISNALGYYAASDIVHPSRLGYGDQGEFVGRLLAGA